MKWVVGACDAGAVEESVKLQSSGERGEASIMFDQRYFEEVRQHSAVAQLCCRVRVTTTLERGINRACGGE